MAVRQTTKGKERGTQVLETTAPNKRKETPAGLSQPLHELSGMEQISRVRAGMTRKDLEQVKEAFGLDYETLAKILSVAKATLFNKKGTATFGAALSEKIFALAALYSYGLALLGNQERFQHWLERENRALGYAKPIELLDTLIGIEEVKHILGRIEQGVYS